LESGIRDPESGKNLFRIPDPGFRGQKGTGTRIRIRNTELEVNCVVWLKAGLASLTGQVTEAAQNYEALLSEQEANRRLHQDLDSRIKVRNEK
jgi:hypothetical protein